MDKETLTNHISRLGKDYFANACQLVLRDIFHLNALNVDGMNDGGTDFAEINSVGKRSLVAYQITTQRSDIKGKAYRDAKKSIEKLGVERYYFLSTYILSESDLRLLENKIQDELGIQSICLDASSIAGLILSENLLHKFLDESNYPLPKGISGEFDYREATLHSYTLLSDDSRKMKESIYDDTILFVLANGPLSTYEEITNRVLEILTLGGDNNDTITKRIGALFGKEKLRKNIHGQIELNKTIEDELLSRRKVYEIELHSLLSAQVDLLREYNIDWNLEDSKKISTWIASAFIYEQIKSLKEIKASIVSHPIFENIDLNGTSHIKKYLKDKKKVDVNKLNKITEAILKLSSDHPLISKITRASMYIALQGRNPISSSKALGASRWSDFNILIEPTVAIPYICSILYTGNVNRYFDSAIKAIDRAKTQDSSLFIPYFYINECAGHLLHARKYHGLDLNEHELQFSNNAFVSNYYALKNQGINVPSNFLDYLSSFSPAIRTEKNEIKPWIRSIMTDIQSLLNRSNIQFVEVPFYQNDDCKEIQLEYSNHLINLKIVKKKHLIDHDVWALKFTNDSIVQKDEHWIILTYDRSLIKFLEENTYRGWITSPIKFLDITSLNRSLSELQLTSLLHTFASYSERTLSIGARIIDRIIMFASKEMQNWQFKQEIESFKKGIMADIEQYDNEYLIDLKTDAFLKQYGINLSISEDEIIDE